MAQPGILVIRWLIWWNRLGWKLRGAYKEGEKMANLPDGKPARKSKTIIGTGIGALGGLISLIGFVVAGDIGLSEALEQVAKYLGPIIALVGYIINQWGHRSIEGENKALMSAVLKGTTRLALDRTAKER